MKTPIRSFVLSLVLVTALPMANVYGVDAPATAPAAPTSAATPRGVIDEVVKQVLGILRDKNLTRNDKLTKIRGIADQQTDFETLARLTMGRYWRDLSDAQKKEFAKEFEEYISTTHGKVFDEYVDEDVIINGEHEEQRGDLTVNTLIVANRFDSGRRKDVATVDYRMRQKDNHWKIIDITISGVSLASNYRAQFQDIMANGGYDRLIKLLREKNVAGKK